jgi:hypothetical protein
MYRTKAKGRFLFRDFAPAFRFFEDLVRYPDHNYSSLQSCSRPASGARRFPYSSVITFAVRAFSCHPSAAQFPECCASLVRSPCGDRCRLSSGSRFRFPLRSRFRSSSDLRRRMSSEFRLRFSARLPSAVPLRVALPVLLEFLSRISCEFRYRFP